MKRLTFFQNRGRHIDRKRLYTGITAGILLSSLTLTASLIMYFQPDAAENIIQSIKSFSKGISYSDTAWADYIEKEPVSTEAAEEEVPAEEVPAPPPYLALSEELGEIEKLSTETADQKEELSYSVMLNTSMGPMLYYNQSDSRWADYLYGGQDPLKTYGCGPAAVAMLLNSFTASSMTPPEAADWSAANGCYAPQGGSYHSLITKSLKAGGLQVQSVKNRTADNAAKLLCSGHILVALMGKGALTDNGHFILITEYLDNGNVHIADPNSYENCRKEWSLSQLMAELKEVYDSGAPLWAVSFPAEG
ncbi:MAG: C39 family peptidase [Clostridiales bacterium]|nr:C39 family peptidase [Clostridiales bacterium]